MREKKMIKRRTSRNEERYKRMRRNEQYDKEKGMKRIKRNEEKWDNMMRKEE